MHVYTPPSKEIGHAYDRQNNALNGDGDDGSGNRSNKKRKKPPTLH